MHDEGKSRSRLIDKLQPKVCNSEENGAVSCESIRNWCAGSAADDCPLGNHLLFQLLFDSVTDSSLIVDIKGNIIEANRSACTILGYEREDLLGSSALEIGVGVDFALDSMRSGNMVTLEGAYRHKDGTRLPVEEHIRAFEFQGQDLFLVCARNISKRRKAEAGMHAALQTWRTTFDAINDAILILDKEHRIMRCNEAATRMLRMPNEEIVGQRCYELMHGAEIPIPRCPVKRMHESSRRETEEVRIGERWFNVTADPIRDAHGNLEGTVHIVSDITEQKTKEETLRQTYRALRLLSQCNSAVVQAGGEQALLSDVCDIAVGLAGYRLAWVGYAEQDEACTVRVVAHSGPGKDLLGRLRISWADDDYGRGTVGTAIRSGKPSIARNLLNNPNFAPWYEFFRELKFGSVISVPLESEGACFGALAIYAAESDAFSTAEVGLLEELGRNLAHGVMALRARRERAEAVAALERAHAQLEDRVEERTAQLSQEIQERMSVERSLRHSEQKYRELVENANSIILKMDEQGRVTFFNEFAQKFFGYEEKELLGRSVVGTIVPETESGGRDLGEMIKLLAQHPEKYARHENENMLKNGERVWIAWTNKPLYNPSGRIAGALCIGNDITELKRTELQLQVFRRVADNARQGHALADLAGRITYMNTALQQMLEDTEWSIDRGLHLSDLHPKEQAQWLKSEVLPALFQQEDWTEELVLLSGKGRRIPGLVNLFLIRDDACNPQYVAELITDMTHQKEAEREILRAKESAESADRIKSAFLASMSHELRTPLNSIIGFTGILLQGLAGELNQEQTKQMGMIQKSARHLLELINDVLDISKIEAGQLSLSIERYNLSDSFEGVIHTIRPLAEKKGLTLSMDLSLEVAEVVSDRRRVEQILINLVNNAIKFTDQGEVRIESTVNAGRIVTVITDTGIGISPGDMSTLFETFRQIDKGVARRYEGSGLGLSICRGLVKGLGGEIWATSEGEGKGSTFTFTLPVARGNEHET
ncbi:MAG: PAS domain S-box protein [Syntrophobacteraceae bacterium]